MVRCPTVNRWPLSQARGFESRHPRQPAPTTGEVDPMARLATPRVPCHHIAIKMKDFRV
ncbi:MAG: hypothetical protein RIR59_930 [Pseudomonadota bacterium]